MKIEVVGSGCPTCKNLYEISQKAVKELEIECDVDYVSGDIGIKRLVALGAMSSPLLVVNGKIAYMGYIPDIEKIKNVIKEALL